METIYLKPETKDIAIVFRYVLISRIRQASGATNTTYAEFNPEEKERIVRKEYNKCKKLFMLEWDRKNLKLLFFNLKQTIRNVYTSVFDAAHKY